MGLAGGINCIKKSTIMVACDLKQSEMRNQCESKVISHYMRKSKKILKQFKQKIMKLMGKSICKHKAVTN